jgi:hypothetical protein
MIFLLLFSGTETTLTTARCTWVLQCVADWSGYSANIRACQG